MRIIFVRHGEPDYDKDCLTGNGIVQAQSTAVRLKDENITKVYSSPMGRARETASYTAKDHGLEVEVLDFMHEINWGGKNGALLPYDGHPWTLACELMAMPEYASGDRWKEHPYFKDNICLDYYEKISAGVDTLLGNFGITREGNSYHFSKPCDDTIAIFAHGGSGAHLISHLLSLPLPFVFTSMPYGVCSVSIFDITPQSGDTAVPRIEIFNDMGHLGNVRLEKLRFEK